MSGHRIEVQEVPQEAVDRAEKNEHSEENQAETYDNEEWVNYESSFSQTQAEPLEGLAEDDQTHGVRT